MSDQDRAQLAIEIGLIRSVLLTLISWLAQSSTGIISIEEARELCEKLESINVNEHDKLAKAQAAIVDASDLIEHADTASLSSPLRDKLTDILSSTDTAALAAKDAYIAEIRTTTYSDLEKQVRELREQLAVMELELQRSNAKVAEKATQLAADRENVQTFAAALDEIATTGADTIDGYDAANIATAALARFKFRIQERNHEQG